MTKIRFFSSSRISIGYTRLPPTIKSRRKGVPNRTPFTDYYSMAGFSLNPARASLRGPRSRGACAAYRADAKRPAENRIGMGREVRVELHEGGRVLAGAIVGPGKCWTHPPLCHPVTGEPTCTGFQRVHRRRNAIQSHQSRSLAPWPRVASAWSRYGAISAGRSAEARVETIPREIAPADRALVASIENGVVVRA